MTRAGSECIVELKRSGNLQRSSFRIGEVAFEPHPAGLFGIGIVLERLIESAR